MYELEDGWMKLRPVGHERSYEVQLEGFYLMTIRRIADEELTWLPCDVCRHPDHNPPSHMYLPNGQYEHECPGCKSITRLAVNHPTL